MRFLTLAFFAALTAGRAVWADEAPPLTNTQISTLFSGATMRGEFVADGSVWAERTTKSGRVLDLQRGRKHVGAWFVTGDQLCYVYFGTPPSRPCYVISIKAGTIFFSDARTGSPIATAKPDRPR